MMALDGVDDGAGADWKVGDWVISDMKIGQITECADSGSTTFNDGWFRVSGGFGLRNRFRPLTLRNKTIAENFEFTYKRLDEIDGHGGFNYPDISSYFTDLSIRAMDAADNETKEFFDAAERFVTEARGYKPEIDGIRLFRRSR